jgi:transcriptional regulator with XRE-family HTH domain
MKKTIHSSDYQVLVTWLKSSRHKKGLSMCELADKPQVSRSWIGKVEQMEHQLDLDVVEYMRLCQCIGIDPVEGIALIQARVPPK